MPKNLVIVESPAKAKTIKTYLGEDFEVIASYGHIRDLIPKTGAVEADNDFLMRYELVKKNKQYAQAILKAAKNHSHLYLATDPDREGEAIAWHIYEFLKENEALKEKIVQRITFNEVTEKAIQEAISAPKELTMSLIDAQQARRALDYLVGFTLSPLLWKKVRRGLSAGRVQSPALRLIVDRELEIEKFQTQEYWTLTAKLSHPQKPFAAKLVAYQGVQLKQFSISTEEQAQEIHQALWKAAQGQLLVRDVQKKERKKSPAAPFITSTLQQEAAHKLGFSAQRTMRIAQQLHEGIETKQGPVGLITYMRTDSTTLSAEATQDIRALIRAHYGKKAVPIQVRRFRTKTKNAQEAHEAIRPTQVSLLPEMLKTQITDEQFRLYTLIWKRTVASQMINATLALTTITLEGGVGNAYKATGMTVKEAGFISVYLETTETNEANEASSPMQDSVLPEASVGDQIPLIDLIKKQHFTEPPPRYNEASLIKTLESHGIGRPSTYVPIITTLQQREYVKLEKKRFYPTDVGRIVYQFLTGYFHHYVDYDFTAQLEGDLDAIARDEKKRIPVLKDFWKPFQERVKHIEVAVQRQEVTQESIDENCPTCNKPLTKRLGKRGLFVGCTGYPDCSYTRNLDESGTQASEPEVLPDRQCPKCQQALAIKIGRYGKFIGCSGYPQCRHIESLEQPSQTGVSCPECDRGALVQRKSRYGKIFYSCDRYPTCQYAIWHPPIIKCCPTCAWPILMVKTTKRKGTEEVCPRKTCGYAAQVLQDS